LAEQFGLDRVSGAAVTEVRSESPAATAGLNTGDVIVEFDGTSIRTPQDLQGLVERAAVNTAHKLTIIRDGTRQTLNVSPAPMPVDLTEATLSGENITG
jgi:serine protease Do